MDVKNVLGIVPGLQATSLLAYNVKNLPSFKMNPRQKMGTKKPIKKIVKTGVTTLVGISLIKPTAEMINTL